MKPASRDATLRAMLQRITQILDAVPPDLRVEALQELYKYYHLAAPRAS